MLFWIFIYIGAVAFLCSYILTFFCRWLSVKLRILDFPDEEKKLHRQPIPLLGGLAIFLSYLLVIFGHIFLSHYLGESALWHKWIPDIIERYSEGAYLNLKLLLPIAGGGLVFFLIGLLDDLKTLPVWMRFFLEFGVSGALLLAGIRFGLGFLPDYLALAATCIWIVGIANAFNLLDGLDGLASGVAAICALILALVTGRANQPLHSLLSLTIAGSASGFLMHNWFPAKIYLGSSGSLFLGYSLAVSTVVATFSIEGASAAFPILMPILLLAVPLYDTASVVLIRLKERHPIFKGDRRHIHHRLLNAGFSEKGSVLFIWCLTLMTGIAAALLLTAELWESILIFSQVAVAFALIVLIKHIRLKTNSNNK
ncbi:MAG: undecaprenyl/decaprenyl-phosphate alpha-N-acetylglucosaminyl 1-phosphate transferase [Planctomycetota bacterium]|nr:undecaprenyl/decaprenyl-phosphate alpha-N-acetylglucosaminyl 1-phosphate transferase [Planctomycetota bacterium]